MESEETSAVDKTALQILASSVGQILGEHSKIHQFVKLAAERPTGINVDRAKRTFDSLPVYQRKRVAETAEGQAHKHKTSMTMSGILGRLGGDAKPRATTPRTIAPPPGPGVKIITPPTVGRPKEGAAPPAKKKSVKEVVWK
jgi:hypothetical protein